MNNKLKVIDLLVKIANGEKVPNKIKDNDGAILDFNNGHYAGNTLTVLNSVYGMKKLNEEIEIIEEYNPIEKIFGLHHPSTKSLDLIKEDVELVFETIDKLIDEVNKLKKEKENE